MNAFLQSFLIAALWECLVFSCKNAFALQKSRVLSLKIVSASQKSRVFPFTVAHSCHQSHVLYIREALEGFAGFGRLVVGGFAWI